MALQGGPGAKVDRQTTTPFLLKLFYRTGTFHRLDEFPSATTSTSLPPHLQIYTWPTCTVSELTALLTSALPSLLPSPAIGTRLAFRLIFPDTRGPERTGPGRYLSKELGSVVVGAGGPGVEDCAEGANGSEGVTAALEGDADRTLADARFVIGDYISCAIFPPLPNGSVAPAPTPAFPASSRAGRSDFGGRGSYSGPPRENGYGGGRGGYGGEYRGGRGSSRGTGFGADRLGGGGVPTGEWRRGERLPEGPSGGGFRGRGRGRGY
ncbi:Sin3 associated polypeptide p18-domain-containing protein [Cryomyces antarcticus]|uniref:Sin3-associated polypeptide Sap18 n=1 Tax=Cryomyces antarcticus TaxID=329879 RepID=A0ABR0LQT9_9PEZI|nr:hypothetical protein LTR60_003510 [Cryomyces antarcticus]KAK5018744.1 hypothetical protein LTR39_000803 [Cryomyces antarcticus]KAK5167233.1 hypothetical protein LTR04_000193 [Oleoguttula sp. CCFEE 6159]KAK5202033.1 hypothetical protein LTR16_000624 [Cryomyces antarcticus]